ncbi:spore coat protein [Desulfoscipio gibsoniae]|uniref:Coat F domain-containing protein n=1 Tax=Desulfoscipio gibsoniae DSM 7213 TaxID=767817 RepID=R4KSZ1_9FIRM|nr:spore coat protein [Desulfoscipio gibsoniae]AGL02716.1 coat F domain-containing protein [Desulfoscipio gibsoniae DSM 7213]
MLCINVSDHQLGEIMDRQLRFAEKEYNEMVSFLSNRNMHKCSAFRKMTAALECADSQLRHIMMQGAMLSEKAYEVFTYLNQKGMYQVPTMRNRTQNNFINTFQPVDTAGTMGMMRSAGTFENRGLMSQPGMNNNVF